jgi:hypothetical protein
MAFWLNTYHPLASSPDGPWTAQPQVVPFADASCRREPDLEASLPAITGLCRTHAVKLLKRHDVVAYFAIKFPYDGERPHRRMTAVLRVEDECTSHARAGDWYRDRDQPLPRNVMLPGNGPLPLEMTEGFYWKKVKRDGKTVKVQVFPHDLNDYARVVTEWDRLYEVRRLACQEVRPCTVLWRDLRIGRRLTDDASRQIFRDGFPITKDRPQEVAPATFVALLRGLALAEVADEL